MLTRVSGSSFARVHRAFLTEPTHMEVEDEDQENEVEDARDGEECRVDSRRVSRQHTKRMKNGCHGMTCATHLEPMSCVTLK